MYRPERAIKRETFRFVAPKDSPVIKRIRPVIEPNPSPLFPSLSPLPSRSSFPLHTPFHPSPSALISSFLAVASPRLLPSPFRENCPGKGREQVRGKLRSMLIFVFQPSPSTVSSFSFLSPFLISKNRDIFTKRGYRIEIVGSNYQRDNTTRLHPYRIPSAIRLTNGAREKIIISRHGLTGEPSPTNGRFTIKLLCSLSRLPFESSSIPSNFSFLFFIPAKILFPRIENLESWLLYFYY